MTNHSSEEIIEMARQRVAERKHATTAQRTARDVPWRYAFVGLLGVLLLGLLAWPGASLDWKLYATVHGVCAQVHNVELGGLQLPICARNTGIYSSFLVTMAVLFALGRGRSGKLPPWSIVGMLVAFIVIMAVDGFNSMFQDVAMPTLYTPRNELRTLTGIGMGMAVAVLLLLVLNVSLRREPDETPVIKNWIELVGIWLLNLLVLVAMYGNIALMYWPIAITAWLGIVGALYCVNLLVSSLMMGYESSVTRVTQLARPATIAVVFTVIELGLLSTLRFYLEGQGMLV